MACIKRDIPITAMAREMGVTRATVYNWFTGRTDPRPQHLSFMKQYLTWWKSGD
jgi:DNA-binding transcriptional regulator YiaG